MDAVEVSLTLPAQAEFLRLARLAAADVASRAGFDYEEVEDLRIAVSELCALISGDETGTLSLTFRLGEDQVEVDGASPAVEPGPLSDDLDLVQGLLAAVVDEHELSRDGGTARFRLLKRRHG